MIEFALTGTVQMVAQNRDKADSYYVRIMPEGHFTFPRQGETASPINVKCGDVAKTLLVSQRVRITGMMAVGAHDWEKPKKFGQVTAQTKEIQNTYFNATKVELIK